MKDANLLDAFWDDEQGVALIVTAILLTVVFLLLAFSMDISRLSIVQAEYKQTSALAALGAFATYWEGVNTDEGSPVRKHRWALTLARKRAERLSGRSENRPLFSAATDDARTIDVDNDWNYFPSEKSVGVLHFGFWHYRPPVNGCQSTRQNFDQTCPCPNKKWQGPCFERQSPRRLKEPATALQLEMFTPIRTPFLWMFAGASNALPRGIRARATVSLPAESEIVSTPRIVENIALPPYGENATVPNKEQVNNVDYENEAEWLDDGSPEPRKKRFVRVIEQDVDDEVPDVCEHGSRQWLRAGFYDVALPAGCDRIRVWLWGAGAAGGNGFQGGGGGYATGAYTLEPGSSLRVMVGTGGDASCGGKQAFDYERYGGPGFGLKPIGWGGGFSALFKAEVPIIIAGGGGAGGEFSSRVECDAAGVGGAGGGEKGEDGESKSCLAVPALGASQTTVGKGSGERHELDGKQLHGGLGGGGGGWLGGGGTTSDSGGASGGSGFISELFEDSKLLTGRDEMPPATETAEYVSPAGQGGTKDCSDLANGKDGMLVLAW